MFKRLKHIFSELPEADQKSLVLKTVGAMQLRQEIKPFKLYFSKGYF